jgi:hypothetical protein
MATRKWWVASSGGQNFKQASHFHRTTNIPLLAAEGTITMLESGMSNTPKPDKAIGYQLRYFQPRGTIHIGSSVQRQRVARPVAGTYAPAAPTG